MKKLLSLTLCLVISLSMLAFPVSATSPPPDPGFLIDRIEFALKDGYTLDDITAEMLDSRLALIEYKYEFIKFFVVGYLAEPSEKNVIDVLLSLRESEYVENCWVVYTDFSFPIFPESPSDVPILCGNYTPYIETDGQTVVYKNMLKNPYYVKNCDMLMAHSAYYYSKLAPYMGDIDFIGYYADKYLSAAEQYHTLIFNAPEEPTGAVRGYNISILEKYFDAEDILYVADSVYAAIVSLSSADKETVKGMQELAFIGDAFFETPVGLRPDIEGSYQLGDVIGDFSFDGSVDAMPVTAADARFILRYSAGLEDGPETWTKKFNFCADVNMDNQITAQDARLALRISAGLEPSYEITFGYADQWTDGAFGRYYIPEE